MSNGRFVVALPVKDEAERLPACLHALTHQDAPVSPAILVLVNNSTDESATMARRFAATSQCQVVVKEATLPEVYANAGGARRLAMNLAAKCAGDEGIILTTDADSRVAPNWLRANLDAISAGADAVAGRAIIDPLDEALIPPALIEADARECQYASLLDEIAATIDPDPADPWPRHDEHSGASISVTVDAFHRAGGVPELAMGEDRALFRNLRRIDARIRHAPDARVIVSGRTVGRAKGGMADTIRRRLVCPDLFLDDRLEGATEALQRALLRRQTRLLWSTDLSDRQAVLKLARDLQLPWIFVREKLASRRFGAAWDDFELASPTLRRRPVPGISVNDQIAAANAILRDLRLKIAPIDQSRLEKSA
jgi:GT2 family glycosyltransferase